MPPKAKITKAMITDAAFEIVREQGAQNLNARSIAKMLNCSTQPVLYYFAKVEDIREEVYKETSEYMTAYVTKIENIYDSVMVEIGLRYAEFAEEEKELFRFLLQSEQYEPVNFLQLLDNPEQQTLMETMRKQTKMKDKDVKSTFASVFLAAHGYACMTANQVIPYDEEYIEDILDKIYTGLWNTL